MEREDISHHVQSCTKEGQQNAIFKSQRNSTAPSLKPLGASFPVGFNVDLNSWLTTTNIWNEEPFYIYSQ